MGRQIVGRLDDATVAHKRQWPANAWLDETMPKRRQAPPEDSLRCVKKLIFFAQFCMVSEPVKRHDDERPKYRSSAGESGRIHTWISRPWLAAFWARPVDFGAFDSFAKRLSWEPG